MRRRVAALLCAGGLAGCTLSDSLRHDDVRSLWAQPGNAVIEQTVTFATDREADGSALGYGLHWSAAAHCGTAVLKIPSAFLAGAMPHWPEGTRTEDFACDGVTDMKAFADKVAAQAAARHCDRVLLFVHGYNVTFRSALLRTGQLATDTQWRCAVALFSWSSEGKYDRYAADIERSGYSVPVLIDVLRALAGRGLKADIVAHSMGARVTLTALAALCAHRAAPLADELILAAPDVSAEHDNDDFGHLLGHSAACVHRTTVYASDNDLILVTSAGVHGGIPRAGRVPERDLQYEAGTVDIVDASAAPGDPFGHGYFVLSYEMMDDMMRVLGGAPAPLRPTLTCAGSPASSSEGQQKCVLRVSKTRAAPDFQTWMLRQLWPLIFRVQ